jgi:hypothetical protein
MQRRVQDVFSMDYSLIQKTMLTLCTKAKSCKVIVWKKKEDYMIHDCSGCRLANKLEPTHIVFEDDLITCFLDIAPLNEGHTLILPKKHYLDVDDLDIETATAIMLAAARVAKALKVVFNPDGISVIQNGGKFNMQ